MLSKFNYYQLKIVRTQTYLQPIIQVILLNWDLVFLSALTNYDSQIWIRCGYEQLKKVSLSLYVYVLSSVTFF